MQKINRDLPTPEQALYGQEMKAIGYEKGYNQHTYDMRRIRAKKEQQLFHEYCSFLEYLNDLMYANRRK